jgi:DNA invertase Pin-like site-specific DNA recombinase
LEKYLSNNVNFGTGGHSKKEHAKKTAEGIKRRRSEGASWGPREKGTPELIEKAKEMLREGVTLTEVCRTLHVATGTLYKHGIRQRSLKNEGKSRKELPLGDQTESENVVRFSKS